MYRCIGTLKEVRTNGKEEERQEGQEEITSSPGRTPETRQKGTVCLPSPISRNSKWRIGAIYERKQDAIAISPASFADGRPLRTVSARAVSGDTQTKRHNALDYGCG